MKSSLSLSLAAVLLALVSQRAYSEVNWAADVDPASIHANLAARNFYINTPNGRETVSDFSTMPNIAFGLDIGQIQGFLDLKAGGGLLLNSSLYTYTVFGTVGWYQEIRPSILFGPHVGICYYTAPDWWNNTDVKFSDSIGYVAGLHFAAGDKISYLLSLDYRYMSFDVKQLPAGVTASESSLNMSGISVQFGIRVQF